MPTINTAQSTYSLDHVISRFPNHMETIQELYGKNPTFREICADYREMAAWLEDNRLAENESSSMHHHALELLQELEKELVDCLNGRHALVDSELWNWFGKVWAGIIFLAPFYTSPGEAIA